MGELGALEEVFQPGLSWTIKGRKYTAPLASAELAIWCRAVLRAAGAVKEAQTDEEMRAAVARVEALPKFGGEELSFAERILGELHDTMLTDGVADAYISFCAKLVYWWIVNDHDEDAAARFWRAGGRPEASSPANRQERRAAAKKTSTAAGSTTHTAASGSGTSSRRRSGNRGRGRRSPGTGS